MVSTFTTNKSFEKPGRGDFVGTWDTPVNTNTGIMDASFGGVASIVLSNSPVTLSSGQYQNAFLRFTGALTANVPIYLPPVGSFYTIINDCTNSSAFYLTASTTVSGARTIGIPPGGLIDIMTDGANARFRGLPAVGTYWDYGGSSTPAWVSACTVPPWIYCNGASFSSATYPALAALIPSLTLPDYRGRMSYYLNDGSSRITSSGIGVDGNTIFATGGAASGALDQTHLPNVSFPVTDPGHTHTVTHNANSGQTAPFRFIEKSPIGLSNAATVTINSAVTGISVNSGGSGTAITKTPPTTVSGIRLIRAA